jgi:MYXO-CTERM domain-containing protein
VNPAAFVLRYAGTATAFLERAFVGRLVAPNALVTVSSTFAGELFAKDIELRPDTVIRCETRDANQLLHPLATNIAREAEPPPAARPRDEYGCACRAPGSPPSGRFAPWLGLSLLIALRRRRR